MIFGTYLLKEEFTFLMKPFIKSQNSFDQDNITRAVSFPKAFLIMKTFGVQPVKQYIFGRIIAKFKTQFIQVIFAGQSSGLGDMQNPEIF